MADLKIPGMKQVFSKPDIPVNDIKLVYAWVVRNLRKIKMGANQYLLVF